MYGYYSYLRSCIIICSHPNAFVIFRFHEFDKRTSYACTIIKSSHRLPSCFLKNPCKAPTNASPTLPINQENPTTKITLILSLCLSSSCSALVFDSRQLLLHTSFCSNLLHLRILQLLSSRQPHLQILNCANLLLQTP